MNMLKKLWMIVIIWKILIQIKIFFLHLRNIFRKLKHTFFGNVFPSQNQPKDEEKKSSKSKESEEDDLTRHYVPPRYFNKEQPPKGLKILTPNQLLTRLPILLAQKKAANNSQKLNNGIRQIICSLYSSKNMSKTVYNHFMNGL